LKEPLVEKENPVVFVVDDDEAICESLCLLIADSGLEARPFHSALQFLSGYDSDQGGCLVLDVQMPGMSGLELLAKLQEWEIDIPIIVITGHADVPTVVAAMKAGALDFIEKPFRHPLLLDSIQKAIALDGQRRRRYRERRGVQSRLRLLTPREREVLGHLITGKANKNIAYKLGIRQKTVDFHRANLLEKLGVQSLVELVHLVHQGTAPWERGPWTSPQDAPPFFFPATRALRSGFPTLAETGAIRRSPESSGIERHCESAR
jgi:two-component system response regulator FixJ